MGAHDGAQVTLGANVREPHKHFLGQGPLLEIRLSAGTWLMRFAGKSTEVATACASMVWSCMLFSTIWRRSDAGEIHVELLYGLPRKTPPSWCFENKWNIARKEI